MDGVHKAMATCRRTLCKELRAIDGGVGHEPHAGLRRYLRSQVKGKEGSGSSIKQLDAAWLLHSFVENIYLIR